MLSNVILLVVSRPAGKTVYTNFRNTSLKDFLFSYLFVLKGEYHPQHATIHNPDKRINTAAYCVPLVAGLYWIFWMDQTDNTAYPAFSWGVAIISEGRK